MTLRKTNVREAFARFDDEWSPKIVGQINGFQAKLVRLAGEFVWHCHPNEDELFLVIEGEIAMEYRDAEGAHVERFGEGELLIVPHGLEHRPVASPGTKVLLFEADTVVNTGDAGGERTSEAQWI